jgi:hypothetical protein
VTTVTADQLVREVQEFLRFKRAMGIPYRRAEFVLDAFVRFVWQLAGDQGEVMLADAITRWCARGADRKPVTLANEFGVVRQLCLYRRRRDPSSYVPEQALAPVKVSIFCPISSATTKCTGYWRLPARTKAVSSGLRCCVP